MARPLDDLFACQEMCTFVDLVVVRKVPTLFEDTLSNIWFLGVGITTCVYRSINQIWCSLWVNLHLGLNLLKRVQGCRPTQDFRGGGGGGASEIRQTS